MKKIFCLIAAFILVSGCDDGDMDLKTFDFADSPVKYCDANNNDSETTTVIYYKINGTEGLTLQLPKGTLKSSTTIDPATGKDVPYEIVLGGSNKLTYRNYVSVPTALCTVAEIPQVTEEWTSVGTLLVSTVGKYKTVEGVQKLTGYIHTVTMENVSFKHDDQTITIVDSPFGDITADNGFTFNFIADGATEPVVRTCSPGVSPIYTLKSPETLTIDLANFDTIFQDITRDQTISFENDEDIAISFNVYQSSANNANVCGQGGDVPSQPIQRWTAESGTLIIKTTETGGIYSHQVYLKDTRFTNTQGGAFELNDVVITTDDGYFFGTYQP